MSERVLIGVSTIQLGNNEPQEIREYELPPSFPERKKKYDLCMRHIKDDGIGAELMGDYQLAGEMYPSESEPQEITTRISSKGASCIFKKCGLMIEQFDADGKKINEMKAL